MFTEIKPFSTIIKGETVDLALVREDNSGLFFALDASYLEQAAGPVISPYNNGTLKCANDDSVEDGSDLMPDVLAEKHGGYWESHPEYPVDDWQHEVAEGNTRASYWQWVASEIESNS